MMHSDHLTKIYL